MELTEADALDVGDEAIDAVFADRCRDDLSGASGAPSSCDSMKVKAFSQDRFCG